MSRDANHQPTGDSGPNLMPAVSTESLHVDTLTDLGSISPHEWNALAGADNPFIDYTFLRALEISDSVGPGTGWQPCHIVVRNADNQLVGATPLYVKTDSYGEYIFDWAWANAAFEAGIPYYPKVVSAIPFTPATGRRLLTVDNATTGAVVEALLSGVAGVAEAVDASSVHMLFITEEERTALAQHDGFMDRLTYQYHWENKPWQSFDEYLQSFRRSARRNVLRERRQVAQTGLTTTMLAGAELEDSHWDALWSFYQSTVHKKGAIPYLNRAFFDALKSTASALVVAALAFDDTRPVAGALSFQKGRHLYGRYWGAHVSHPALHFELCYYQHIEACIANGWTRFEAGAQGPHKLKRGLMPCETYSVHWIRDAGLADAVARFLPRERLMVTREINAIKRHGPFKRTAKVSK